MKTLIISGSPRKDGDSMALVNVITKHIKGEVKIIYTYSANVSPCVDCRYCWSHSSCSIKDEMQEIYKLINEVDNIIISSPVYFSELTGSLLSFFSRLQLFYGIKYIQKTSEFKLKKKYGALIISAGGATANPAANGFERAEKTADIIFKLMNTESIGVIRTAHTDVVPGKEDAEAIKSAEEIVNRLNSLCLS